MIKKNITYKWLDIEAFYKITSYKVLEQWKDEIWKFYLSRISLTSYSDINKVNDLEQVSYDLIDLRVDQLTIETFYNILKTFPEFEWSIDC